MKPETDPAFLAAYKVLFDQGLTYYHIAKRLGISRSKAAEIGKAHFVQEQTHRNTFHNWQKKGN